MGGQDKKITASLTAGLIVNSRPLCTTKQDPLSKKAPFQKENPTALSETQIRFKYRDRLNQKDEKLYFKCSKRAKIAIPIPE